MLAGARHGWSGCCVAYLTVHDALLCDLSLLLGAAVAVAAHVGVCCAVRVGSEPERGVVQVIQSGLVDVELRRSGHDVRGADNVWRRCGRLGRAIRWFVGVGAWWME